jgi:Tol biopolymer transport system component
MFEIRLSAENQVNDLVVHTTNLTWTMPKDMWRALAVHTIDPMPINVTIRGSSPAGPPSVGSTGRFSVAPTAATGSMVYWSTKGVTMGEPTGDDTLLSGFAVGDESVVQVLTPPQAQQVTKDQGGNRRTSVKCIGCHTSTPDGEYVAFNDHYPWGISLASTQPGTVGAAFPSLTAGGFDSITRNWLGISSFSAGHWAPGDRILIATMGTQAMNDTTDKDPNSQLAWFNLEAASSVQGYGWDRIARTGDPRGAAAPSWSHDGNFIVYTSTNAEKSGRLDAGIADLYMVPYNNRMGGNATPINGAADPAFAEYYPALSGDDQLIAFNRISAAAALQVAAPTSGMYAQPASEVFVIPTGGGQATRLLANDPPACTGAVSPGVNNNWAKWSPEVRIVGNRKFYWLIFSSWRDGKRTATGLPIAQLYAAAVVTDELTVQTYPAIYLWNQPDTISNHTPAWDVFKIPVIP